MSERKEGLVIRTAFNNQGWAAPCKKPFSDRRCFKCVEGGLFINWGNPITEDENGTCKGNPEDYPLSEGNYWCWEQVLCKKYFWGNVKGKWRQAREGMPVYFVYVESDGTLTLWGHSVIERIDNEHDEYPPIYFKPFEPLPQEKWITGLTGYEITGKKWGQLHFRYLDAYHVNYLASLVEGKAKHESGSHLPPMRNYEELKIDLRRDIKEKLEKIAHSEGRDVEELVREAVAKIIRERR